MTRAERMIEMLKNKDAGALLEWWEEIFEDGVPAPDSFAWWLEREAEE